MELGPSLSTIEYQSGSESRWTRGQGAVEVREPCGMAALQAIPLGHLTLLRDGLLDPGWPQSARGWRLSGLGEAGSRRSTALARYASNRNPDP